MSDDFDADAIAHTLVSSWAFRSAVGQWAAGLDEQPTIERQIAAALRAAEARGLERAKRNIRHWSLTQAETLRDIGVCDALISFIDRALSKSPD